MLGRIRKAQENHEGGFTLIELLVVMIIIGILSAIAIPTFLSQKDKARESSVKADVKSIATEIEGLLTDGNPTSMVVKQNGAIFIDGAGTAAATPRLSKNNTVKTYSYSGGAYCVSVKNADAAAVWSVAAGQLTKADCTGGTATTT